MRDKRRGILLFICSSLTLIITASSTFAAQSNGALAQGFPVDTEKGDVVAGSLVSLKTGSRSVELATSDTSERLAGIADQDPLLTISNASAEAQVVLSGSTSALVSDINGTIHTGDKITASPIAGVGMKATSDSRIVGTAQSDFDIRKSKPQSISDIDGAHHTVNVGYISVQVGLSNYTAPDGNFLPPFLQSFANSVAGKEVSIIRITFCAILLLFSLISLAILISSAVRSAITSLGRNPLAAPNIRKSLYQVGGISVATLGGTLLACYLILVL